MIEIDYIFAHGSDNRFVMIDCVAMAGEVGGEDEVTMSDNEDTSQLVRVLSQEFKSDGVLFVERTQEGYYAMNMYNTDGTRSRMCGNGMRIVARLCDERYLHSDSFTLASGGGLYPIRRYSVDGATHYGVEIAITRGSEDFVPTQEGFLAQPIAELEPSLTFSFLNLGNPHIVTQVDEIDYDMLTALGERVKTLKEIFPNGVNVSMMKHLGGNEIFVATYERGVGLTASCGTAMTASSTTAALLGLVEWESAVVVRNRGEAVRCICHREELKTELIGNATYIDEGVITLKR